MYPVQIKYHIETNCFKFPIDNKPISPKRDYFIKNLNNNSQYLAH